MKQSNIILGIGILVAIILIAGSLFLNADPIEEQSAAKQVNPVVTVSQATKNIALMPFQALSRHIIKIN